MAIYLTLDGIDGPIDKPIAKSIELSSVQFGVGCALTKQKNLGFKREGEPSLSEITVSKVTDKASTNLFKQVCGGSYFKKGEVTVTKLIGDKPTAFFKLSLEEVFVSGWAITSSGQSPQESLSLAFNKIKIAFNPEADGDAKGFVEAGWSHLTDTSY